MTTTSVSGLAPAPVPPLSELVDAVSRCTGAWVAVERFGDILAHGRGRGPCPASMVSAIVTKQTAPLREAVRWTRGRNPLHGTVDGVPVHVADIGAGAAVWFVDGPLDAASLPSLTAAMDEGSGPMLDSTVASLLEPRGPARPGSAPQELLVALLAEGSVAQLSRRAAAVVAGQTSRVHVHEDVVLVALSPDAAPEGVVQQVRAAIPTAVAGAAEVPDGASDWAATFRLAVGLARAASACGLALGRADDPPVVADLLLQEAQSAVADLAHRLPNAPLRRVAEYDARTAGQLMETVAAWCRAGLDVSVAAEAMHLHQNTFRYRLKRASQISGLDLSHPRQVLALQLLLT